VLLWEQLTDLVVSSAVFSIT